MNLLRNFLMFWVDFIVGDAVELAAGVVVALIICAALNSTILQNATWLILPLLIGLSLAGSLVWHIRKQPS
jgi:hypothetical protein